MVVAVHYDRYRMFIRFATAVRITEIIVCHTTNIKRKHWRPLRDING
ncbi:MAG: hypothetical protein LH481_04505 [Burkholderiales bacterium]|nr:hypothetical protein [Burkholderiales bacterium]